jgi:hypothetical protein
LVCVDGLDAMAPLAFAPEAHMPRGRRLVINTDGVTLENGIGVRHTLPWLACRAVMLWPDRAELILDDEISLVIRASEWHHGSEALRALQDRAPAGVLLLMPEDPEPQPTRYTLQGLAASSSAVLVCLFLSLTLVAAIGIGIGEQDRRASALVVGMCFAIAAFGTLRSLVIRLNVPRRWRLAAAVRGRTAVAVDSYVAGASDRRLAIAEPSLYVLAGLTAGVLAAMHEFNLLPSMLLLGLALAVSVERARRHARHQQP